MNTVILNKASNYANPKLIYSKAFKLAFPMPSTGTVNAPQLYSPEAVCTNTHHYDLSGSVIKIRFWQGDGSGTEEVKIADITDTVAQRRVIVTKSASSPTFKFYYQTNSVSKVFSITGSTFSGSLYELTYATSSGTLTALGYLYARTEDLTVTSVSSGDGISFSSLSDGIECLSDMNGAGVSNNLIRFRNYYLSVDDRDVCNIQVISNKLYDWVNQSFFANTVATATTSDQINANYYKEIVKSNQLL